ncbi:hypothetical protein AVEN_211166-1 [Araneus ventricosus]|uniref:Uncharacterized protein n=1 Tax=Araneus ventricosus TaxID=182803 RepID=A0A4Y2ME05_ARAVE|nr:hypothetical protein AVEN_211166-1 [Araneus ventricosus]
MMRTAPELALPLQISLQHQREGVPPPECDLACGEPTYTAYLRWNRVSNLEPLASNPREDGMSYIRVYELLKRFQHVHENVESDGFQSIGKCRNFQGGLKIIES